MELEFLPEGAFLTVSLKGELDHHVVGEVRKKIDFMLNLGVYDKLIIDLRGLGFMDSSGIALVMGRVNFMRPLGGSVEIISDKPEITRILRLADIEKYAVIREA